MKYILMMHFTLADWKAGNTGTWKPEDIKANVDFLTRFNKDLAATGELVDAVGLAGPDETVLVRNRPHDVATITDGPFPETKEFLAGYWIVDVANVERAYEIAKGASAMPGPGGIPSNLPIEVRKVMFGVVGAE